MSQVVRTEVFSFDELDDSAKEKAREWYREGALDYEWYDSVYDDAKRLGAMIGIEIEKIYFSGFWSQGDGACFVGSYSYAKGGAAAIKKEAPGPDESNVRLHQIAAVLQELQRVNFYRLEASISHRGRGSHELCTEIHVSNSDGESDVSAESMESLKDALRDFMRWIYRQLETEYEYLNGDEQVDESILANGYTFTESGRRFG